MNYLSRETKKDAVSSLLAAGGIVLAVVASEFTMPLLMGLGVALVGGTAIARVANLRGQNQEEMRIHQRNGAAEEKALTHSGPRA